MAATAPRGSGRRARSPRSTRRPPVSALRSYTLLVRWTALRQKGFLPFALIIPQIAPRTILFIATAAPSITLITMGLVAVPQQVAQARTEGTLDYMRALPIPRVVYLLADLTVQLLIVLPGVVFGVIVATWRFNLPIEVSPWVVPAVILVVLTAT